MSTITKERVAQFIKNPLDNGLTRGEQMELARIALASLEAEESGRNPVLAYADSYRDMAKQGVESIPVWSVITDLERNIAPLFTAHPASAVNAEPVAFINGAREPVLYGEHIGIAIATQLYTAPPAPVSVPLAIHDEDFEKALSVLNDTLDDCGDSERGLLLALDKAGIEVRSDACRAAMLQGADGNSPVIPDGWVACSERMPEDEQEVLTINKMGHRFVSFFDEHSGLFFDRIDVAASCCIEHILVTHWMPLPAAPQQEA